MKNELIISIALSAIPKTITQLLVSVKILNLKAIHSENNPHSFQDPFKWWNMFKISEIVSKFETKASSSITNRHENLNLYSTKLKRQKLSYMRVFRLKGRSNNLKLIATFHTISNEKDTFERTLVIVIEISSAANKKQRKSY